MKRQSTEWEKIFVNYILDKRLMSRIYEGFVSGICKELLQFNNNNNKKKAQFKNGQRIWIDFSPKDIHKHQYEQGKDAQYH